MPTLTKPALEPLGAVLPPGAIKVDESLYEAWQPLIFVTHDRNGQRMLAYLADETEDGEWYFLAPISAQRLDRLKDGALTIRDALLGSWIWQCLETAGSATVWSVEPETIPDAFLPLPGVPLLPEQEAVLITRAVGDGIQPGSIPASVVAFVADATRKAVKTLLDYYSNSGGGGRPLSVYKAQYDLPIQRFAFASFEVSFAAPEMHPRAEQPDLFSDELEAKSTVEGETDTYFRRSIASLQSGLRWASSEVDAGDLTAQNDAERVAILQAVNALTPPSGGAISAIEVSGTGMNQGIVRLERGSRKKVQNHLRSIENKRERVVTHQGRIGEVDHDLLTLTLRSDAQDKEYRASFGDDLLDDVLAYFFDAAPVDVIGIETKERTGRLRILAIAPPDVD